MPQLRVLGDDPDEVRVLGVAEMISARELKIARTEDRGIEGRSLAVVADALDAPADLDEPGREPAHAVEAVDDMSSMAQVGLDRRPISLGAVGDDDLDTLEPAVACSDRKHRKTLALRCSTTPKAAPVSAFTSTVTYRWRRRNEVSSMSSTRQRWLLQCSATRLDQVLTSAMTVDHENP
jgi:hypothetical protein